MKLLSTFAIAAVAMMAVPTLAMAKDCGTRPAKLSVPDGATSSEDQMKAFQGKLTPYAKDMNTYLQCLAGEIKSGKDEYESVSAQWTAESKKFSATPAK